MRLIIKYIFVFAVPNIFELDEIWTHDVIVYDTPWKLQIKREKSEDSLAVYLFCANKEVLANRTHEATATVKLLSYNDDVTPYEKCIGPCVFDDSGNGTGYSSFIKWHELFDESKYYIKNDTIRFCISIVADNPNEIEDIPYVVDR